MTGMQYLLLAYLVSFSLLLVYSLKMWFQWRALKQKTNNDI